MFLETCSPPPSRVEPPSAPVTEDPVSQTGIASWYGPGFHGRPTASTALYNQNELTAAHPTLPLGSRVLVTNLENGNATEVTINDRGPFVRGRIIDLSFAAGKLLGMIEPGTVPVRLEVIDAGPLNIRPVPRSLDYTLQLGAFSHLENAEQLRERLSYSHVDVSIVPMKAKDVRYYRVQLGAFVNRSVAEQRARQLSRAGLPVMVRER
jgi:peptidoglycan lytic transglycosylase